MIARKTRALVIPTVVVLLAGLGYTKSSISTAEAKNQVGERATVCGEVASTRLRSEDSGKSDVHQSRQAISEPDFYGADLGH
jgi:hypothetical protein